MVNEPAGPASWSPHERTHDSIAGPSTRMHPRHAPELLHATALVQMGRPRLLSSSTIVDCAAGGLSAAKSLLLLRDLAVPCPASCFCEPPTSLPTHPHARQTEPFESWTTGASESPPPRGLDEDEDEEAVHRVSSKYLPCYEFTVKQKMPCVALSAFVEQCS